MAKDEEQKKSEAEEILEMVNDPNFDWAAWDAVGMIPHTQADVEALIALGYIDISEQPTEPIPKINP